MPVKKKAKPGIREAMFGDFLEEMPLSQIARKYGVNEKTVGKYQDEDNWKSRKSAIIRKAQDQFDLKAVTSLANEARVIDAACKWLAAQAVKVMQSGKFKGNVWDELRKMIDSKIKIKEVVDPEIPPEIPKDEMAEAVKELGEKNLKDLARVAAAQVAKKRDAKASK